jgi:hypothetical protein
VAAYRETQLNALGDATRRNILERLLRGPASVSFLTAVVLVFFGVRTLRHSGNTQHLESNLTLARE